ncbi:MAG: ATP-binding cassette domain-containing protein [Bacteroidetes bacterium]|nr:ATP-binding cassette domain-containing protein [Bacteroidota bacterium]MCY4232240.1 ATP-binding cassette domain-containing protein [Bacteroidota bacterium]
MNSLILKNVTKRFGDVVAVSDISFKARQGRILGLLGPNGAGKTTIIRIVTSILNQDSGDVRLHGRSVGLWSQEQIGYLPEERGLYKKLKVNDQLQYFAELKGVHRKESKDLIKYWLDRLGLGEWGERKAQDLSKGMQQKIQFIATILSDPRVIILDEPFSGLDPVNAELLSDIIAHFKQEGRIILFASHRMEQVEKVCDDICLIAKGQLILSGDLIEVKRLFPRNKLALEYAGNLPFLDSMEKRGEIQILERYEGGCLLGINQPCKPKELLNQLLKLEDFDLYRFDLLQPSLNEIFIRMVGENI